MSPLPSKADIAKRRQKRTHWAYSFNQALVAKAICERLIRRHISAAVRHSRRRGYGDRLMREGSGGLRRRRKLQKDVRSGDQQFVNLRRRFRLIGRENQVFPTKKRCDLG